ncbi:MAG: MBL fold metallo-hydrolase [Deltaproteobacteria bacterium]|nr:MBL fold metallo-hydrolase [Deltaproteobacteria bacterium]
MSEFEYTQGLHKLAEGVYTYFQPPGALGGSNAGLVVDGGVSLLVDTFYDLNRTGDLLREIKKIPGAWPVNYLINTHVDGDHTFGNQLVEGAEIIASKACAEEFTRDISPEYYVDFLKRAPTMGKAGKFFLQGLGQYDFEGIRLTPPTRTFEGRLDLKIGGKEVNLIEVGPAHTEGDIMVYLPGDKLLFSGDVVMTSVTPVSWHGPSANLIKAMSTILGLEVNVLVPGHGPIVDKSFAQKLKEYWEYTAEEARKQYDKGISALEAGIALASTGKFSNFPLPATNIANVHMLYREFSGEETPLDKFAILGKVAELLIPD